ncbi:hypothetical protein ACLESO_53805 [Pyxidicoccus sp. 3LG]
MNASCRWPQDASDVPVPQGRLVLMYRERARLPLDDSPHLLAWFDSVRELPAWRNSEAVW